MKLKDEPYVLVAKLCKLVVFIRHDVLSVIEDFAGIGAV